MPEYLSRRAFLYLASSGVVVAGCGAVPRGAPLKREVLADADAQDAQFGLEIVSRARLSLYPQWGPSNGYRMTGWPSGGAVPKDQRLAAGDRLALRIWDTDESSLLASPGAQFADVANVTVTGSGHVNLPYLNEVHVAGLTAEAARRRLQEQLTTIAPSAQVQLEVTPGRRNSIDMVGGVAKPGTYPMAERDLPLSSLISAAGGASTELLNPQVQITRGGHVYRRPLEFVLSDPANDPPLRGGDRVLLQSDKRSFKALGAAGREDVIGFDAERVSALRAISLMGGMADTRADPRGILVLRRYPDNATSRKVAPPNTRMVFSFDLTTADGLFSADEFQLQNGDVVMATQAPATSAQRVLGLFGSILSTGRAVGSL